MTGGTCQYCGCTAERACAGGCTWIDITETICSACVAKIPPEEFEPLVLGHLAGAQEVPIQLVMDVPTAFVLMSVIQLALRHPDMPQRRFAFSVASDVAEALSQRMAEISPVLGEASRRGRDPQFDVLEPVDPMAHWPSAVPIDGEEVSPGGIILP